MKLSRIIALNIKSLRESQALTQVQLAEKAKYLVQPLQPLSLESRVQVLIV